MRRTSARPAGADRAPATRPPRRVARAPRAAARGRLPRAGSGRAGPAAARAPGKASNALGIGAALRQRIDADAGRSERARRRRADCRDAGARRRVGSAARPHASRRLRSCRSPSRNRRRRQPSPGRPATRSMRIAGNSITRAPSAAASPAPSAADWCAGSRDDDGEPGENLRHGTLGGRAAQAREQRVGAGPRHAVRELKAQAPRRRAAEPAMRSR